MSNPGSNYQTRNLGASALSVFFASYSASQKQIEQSLLMLEMSPDDDTELKELQQSILVIEKALPDIGLDQLQQLTQSINRLLQAVREKHVEFETVISDLILLGIDDIKMVIEKMIDGDKRCVLMTRLPRICETIESICTTDESSRKGIIRDALLLLDPGMEIIETAITNSDSLINLFSKDIPDEEELAAYGVEESDDFIFFRSLSEPLEGRANYWRGRVYRMLRLALKMNDYAGRPVDPNQLAAAIYMHDVGMALLPLHLINSQSTITDEDREQIRQHTVIGYELMRYMKNWGDASLMVLQHHEQMDGKGYPYGLVEKEICEGAKIIAIVDMVDARTHERAHAMLLKRPLLRAAIELGKHSGEQFSEKWVNVFKDVFQEMRSLRKES